MIVIVSENVVQAVVGTPDAYKLHRLLGFACERRHVVYFDPPSCVEAWVAKTEDGCREGYQKAIKNAGREARCLERDAAMLRIDQIATPDWGDPEAILPLDDALKVLGQKLGFVLEHADNDWHFLLGMMLQSQRKRILHAVEQGWAEPVHGGGADIKARLNARLEQPYIGLRTALMFDSDRMHPDELGPDWHPNQIPAGKKQCLPYDWEKLAQEKLPNRYWRLQRRFIESYMPKVEFAKALEDKYKNSSFEAFWRMTQDQRWYYPMKKGFEKDKQYELRQRNLYSELSESDTEALQTGFGREFARHYAAALERDFAWDDEARKEAEINLPRFLRLL